MARAKKNKSKRNAPTAPMTLPAMNADDEDLMNDLMAELDSRDQIVQAESAKVLNEMQLDKQVDQIESSHKQDAKSRFKARQVRKAAALAQSYTASNPEEGTRLEEQIKLEEMTINRLCDELNVQLHEIKPDGHCLFSAVADQLVLLNILSPSEGSYITTRKAASEYIHSHPDQFLPFLPSAEGEDGLDGVMSEQEFEKYCISIRDTAVWGGEPEILALSRVYNVSIHVIQGGRPSIVEHTPSGSFSSSLLDERVVRISYHRKMYALGEHYNSLRPKSDVS